ncbi:MAG: hypothetical protein M3O30_02225 [Planctomycetota bacterium]|nr:hypothetical protein [Planctomycetota bacterium]
MSTGARVESIDSIKEFRVYLAKFQETAGLALSDADSDLNKMATWLEGEQQAYCTQQIRKKQEILVRAEEALRNKKLFKDSSGSQPSAVEEIKAVTLAKKNLAEAQQKLVNVKGWVRKLQKEIVLYRGGVGRFAGAVSGGIPSAIAQLGNTIEALEKYTGIAAVGAGTEAETVGAGAMGGPGGGSGMGRPTDTAPKVPATAPPVDPAAIRATAPSAEVLASAAAKEGGLPFAVAKMTQPQKDALAEQFVLAAAPVDDVPIALGASAIAAARVFFVHDSLSGWRIGSVDDEGAAAYNTITAAELRGARADLGELLRLPAGSLAVVGAGGLETVFDLNNQIVLRGAEMDEAADVVPAISEGK